MEGAVFAWLVLVAVRVFGLDVADYVGATLEVVVVLFVTVHGCGCGRDEQIFHLGWRSARGCSGCAATDRAVEFLRSSSECLALCGVEAALG